MNDVDPIEVEQYRSLWTTHRDNYVLVQDEDHPEPRIINITRKYPEVMVFSDDGLGAAVARRVLEEGIPVVTWVEMKEAMQRRHCG